MMMRFGSSTMIAGAMASAIGFYTLSLHVSAERAKADELRAQIASDLKDIRALEAELRTRARLPVLQKWNDEVLALSAPTSKQFADTVQLAAFAPNAPAAAAAAPHVQLAITTPEAAALPTPGVMKASYQAPALGDRMEVASMTLTSPSSQRRRGPAVEASANANEASGSVSPRLRGDDGNRVAAKQEPAAPVNLAEAKPKLPKAMAKPVLNDLDALTSAIDNAVATERGGFRKVAMQ
jgi:hypothetical protein